MSEHARFVWVCAGSAFIAGFALALLVVNLTS